MAVTTRKSAKKTSKGGFAFARRAWREPMNPAPDLSLRGNQSANFAKSVIRGIFAKQKFVAIYEFKIPKRKFRVIAKF
ncbi:hypothetical protein OFO03_04280 [Campylobacter sp. JMF_02 ED1]|uniref:hypothetical protein n=1 Tax=unclassified Campylobacter TaxID=2593542 RepID=UPI0022E9CBC8|nr:MULTISPECIES: hypothetical protein [unclassified Campylobacter]MDA3049464.1 hypothetical protein [Campylobacter sp. JMF_15 NE4]MDA3051109.1 hypothetical protein [Campylobacter sp. JMF_02 ED1]